MKTFFVDYKPTNTSTEFFLSTEEFFNILTYYFTEANVKTISQGKDFIYFTENLTFNKPQYCLITSNKEKVDKIMENEIGNLISIYPQKIRGKTIYFLFMKEPKNIPNKLKKEIFN